MLKKTKKEVKPVEIKVQKKEVKEKIVEEVKPVTQSFKSKLLVGDIEEFYNTAKPCIELKGLEYEVHIIIQDTIKKIINCKKDHGY